VKLREFLYANRCILGIFCLRKWFFETTLCADVIKTPWQKSVWCYIPMVGMHLFRAGGNIVGLINEVTLHRAGLVLRWVTVRWYTVSFLIKPPRPTQPGHPSVGRRNEYWRWLRTQLGKKQRGLRSGGPSYQDGSLIQSFKALAVKGAGHPADLLCVLLLS